MQETAINFWKRSSPVVALIGLLIAVSSASAQAVSPSPTWDVYPARTTVMSHGIVQSGGPVRRASALSASAVFQAEPFGGFSLPAEVPTFFSGTQAGPRGGATFAIRQALDNARRRPSDCGGQAKSSLPAEAAAQARVLVQAYSFTSAPIAEALLKAHRRGVKVRVLLDKSQRTEKYSSADFLANAGISTKISARGGSSFGGDAAHVRRRRTHNKVMIIDNEIVITGSFNFTKAAEESNAENLLAVHDKELASRYIENWQLHDTHSEPYLARTKRNVGQAPKSRKQP